jgi:hypothetical protein
VKVQSDNLLNADALLDPNRLDQSRVDLGQQARGLAAEGPAAPAPLAERSVAQTRDPGEDVLQASVWDDASPRSLAHFAGGFDASSIAPDAQALDRAADAILAGLVD